MSEAAAQERTEQATPKRVKESRERGEVPRSRELLTFGVTMAATIVILLAGKWMGQGLLDLLRITFEQLPGRLDGSLHMQQALWSTARQALIVLAPLFAVVVVATVASSSGVGGMNFSAKTLAPKFSRLNPASGIKRVFSVNGLVELVKSLAKFLLVATVVAVILGTQVDDLLALGRLELNAAIARSISLLGFSLLAFASPLALIALADAPFQIWQHNKKQRMTKEEVKQEHKETEGRPEVKQRIRQQQRALASQRMAQEVPKADVIVTNPTHFATALRYDQATMRAPQMVAKGADEMAMRIREIAKQHDVPIVSAPPLARALFRTAEPGQEVPQQLYAAVARIIAYVYQLRGAQTQGLPTPELPEIEIDEAAGIV